MYKQMASDGLEMGVTLLLCLHFTIVCIMSQMSWVRIYSRKENLGILKLSTSAETDPIAELLLLIWLFNAKLCSPEGCFLNKSKGTLAETEESPE